jgi:hypothetical protein
MLKQPGRTTGHFKSTRLQTAYENRRRNSSSAHRQQDNASITKKPKKSYTSHTPNQKTTEIEQQKWNVEFTWIKAHAGHRGNELADKLAKDAAGNKNEDECYNRFPKSAVQLCIYRRVYSCMSPAVHLQLYVYSCMSTAMPYPLMACYRVNCTFIFTPFNVMYQSVFTAGFVELGT